MAKITKILSIFLLLLIAPAAYADPISLTIMGTAVSISWGAIAAATLAVASAAVGISTAAVNANQQKAMANYQRQVNMQNAKASKEAAQAKIENQRRQAKFTYGTQLARLGGMGALAEGSPLDIMGQSAGQQEYDNMVTEYEGEVQAIQFQQQAALNKYEHDMAEYNLGLNATKAVVGSAAKYGDSILGGIKVKKLGTQGNFTTPTGKLIDVGRDYLTDEWTV